MLPVFLSSRLARVIGGTAAELQIFRGTRRKASATTSISPFSRPFRRFYPRDLGPFWVSLLVHPELSVKWTPS